MFDMPPPDARHLPTVFTHQETVREHPLLWITFTTATHVQIILQRSDDTEEWVGNVFLMEHARRPPLLRWSWRHREWLGTRDSDPTGHRERTHLTTTAHRLWNTANYR